MKTLTLPELPARFAVLADIHGNADALAAVLTDMERFSPEAVLILGDHVSGPLDPARTAEMLMGLDAHFLAGNHDVNLHIKAPEEMWGSDRIAHDALSADQLNWLRAQPDLLDAGDVWACHATPHHNQTYWAHRASASGGMEQRPLDEIADWAAPVRAPLMLCAHTHLPVQLRLPSGQILFNPGSVGCPSYDDDRPPLPHKMETGTPAACYAVIDRVAEGFAFTQRYLPYDSSAMAEAALGYGARAWASAVTTGFLDQAFMEPVST